MVLNAAGQAMQLEEQVENENLVAFDMSDLSAGVYYVTVKTNKGTQTKKIVKMQ